MHECPQAPPPSFFLSQQPSHFGTVQGLYCTVSYTATVLRPDAELLLAPILGNLIGLHPVSYVLRSISDSEKPPSPGIPDLGSQLESTRTCICSIKFHSESSLGLAPEDPQSGIASTSSLSVIAIAIAICFGWLLRDTSSLSEAPVLFVRCRRGGGSSSGFKVSTTPPQKKISCLRRSSGPPGQTKTKESLCCVPSASESSSSSRLVSPRLDTMAPRASPLPLLIQSFRRSHAQASETPGCPSETEARRVARAGGWR